MSNLYPHKRIARRLATLRGGGEPMLVQERAGFHLGIAPDITAAGRHAAAITRDRYKSWLTGSANPEDTAFKRQHFTIAVGGGNTVKNEYKALLRHHFDDINWLDHVRFFFVEETCNRKGRESSLEGLAATLLRPLAHRLIGSRGSRELGARLGLGQEASAEAISDRIVEVMTFPIRLQAVSRAVADGDRQLALAAARSEARRYQRLLRERLGPAMACHVIIAGIGRDGGIGALSPYTPQLRGKRPAVIALDKVDGAISVQLNRGILTAAGRISLIISGSLKLRALGRFEMEDGAGFEQTVMETPIRIFRETREIAEKVYIFADDRALLFEEGAFRYRERGIDLEVKSEIREGDEERGVHILLVHGFMGLYSFVNLLVGLPSAWRVSALRRGKHAKTLPDEEVFPHYANALKKMILHNWRSRRPTPICCHSMAGVISDHLLLSMLRDYGDEWPEFDRLRADDQKLVEALRAAGIIEIATWAPSDLSHITRNIEQLMARRSSAGQIDISDPQAIYDVTPEGGLRLNEEHSRNLRGSPAVLEKLLRLPGIEPVINAFNVAIRSLLRYVDLQKLMKQQEAPYGQRLLSSRVLSKASFYGVLKEVNASMRWPREYQERHLKSLDAVIKYDIPYLVIVHRDDFMVSANRHVQEHEYLLAARMQKEGVSRESALSVPARLVLLEREEEDSPADIVNSHFLILSTSRQGAGHAREVTAAITRFVIENVARAVEAGQVQPLASVSEWQRKQRR